MFFFKWKKQIFVIMNRTSKFIRKAFCCEEIEILAIKFRLKFSLIENESFDVSTSLHYFAVA